MPESTRTKITGDVATTADVKVDARGGHLVVNLQPGLVEHVNHRGQLLSGASLQFDDGHSVVLLSGGAARDRSVLVRKTGVDRYEIARGPAIETQVDELETAFLRLKIKQFTAGELNLGVPEDAAAWSAAMRDRLATAETALAKGRSNFAEA